MANKTTITKWGTLLLTIAAFYFACGTQKKVSTTLPTSKDKAKLQVAFYNVENLFDTEDDPLTEDDEFTPHSAKNWSKERYQDKLDKLAKVIDGIGKGKTPAIIGLSEVENAQVMTDLIQKTPIPDSYQVVHYDSPDVRGIDVGLIYDSEVFKLIDDKKYSIQFPFDPLVKTRDILYVKGSIKEDTIHLFVNHWSSRRGGQEASEPKRVTAAKVLRTVLDSVFMSDEDAKVLIMGDFNDEPTNKSVLETLKAKPDTALHSLKPFDLCNMSYTLKQQSYGTYRYKGNWNMLDQMIVSGSLVNDKNGLRIAETTARIFQEPWMMYEDRKYGPSPSRTYGGPNYYGGYSDHLPTYLNLKY